MLDGLPILIAEDQALVALDLALVVERLGGLVVGPVASVAEAMKCVEEYPVAAAILDANLVDRDVTPLAIHLLGKGTPFVVYTGTGLPDDLVKSHPALPVVLKPTPAERVVTALIDCIRQTTSGRSAPAGNDATAPPAGPDRDEDRPG
jgi:DNA-binding NtrC family response regulator